MANIFYAWELGANLGHIGAFLPIARQLRERQHRVEWVVAQPYRASRMLPAAGFDWLQAPLMPEVHHKAPPANYADILLRFGYAQAQDLFGLVVAWRKLMGITGAKVVLADHAPNLPLMRHELPERFDRQRAADHTYRTTARQSEAIASLEPRTAALGTEHSLAKQ